MNKNNEKIKKLKYHKPSLKRGYRFGFAAGIAVTLLLMYFAIGTLEMLMRVGADGLLSAIGIAILCGAVLTLVNKIHKVECEIE